ncbi:2-amino-4-hydroxy-6-hydroxymethyldihydropteridine diphosphokinase [Alkanindiges illinoisensis]|uniref:2-amino-4-hydroxy-6-hydroxymethyldihydropteridine pyrophosphokinase n=1 Tax=Alkanindiges illinoisensis TaxID=197183 RepID=A0A4Y7XAS9_9GAMM|nr:2-amino-4-hydroxy-6-hydroxymethyldihydropteridine diphosphokinase [Alkanindiges illinoisensis]TEU25058.1 2-amino-4-hydroxy-6-hydroxymethyldihydropteridine diphosphokinase [Alkanindiges illinoisensis]
MSDAANPLVYIGLGSNLSNQRGDSRQILQQAVQALKKLASDPVQVSGLYLSKPMGPQDQPDYFNAVARFKTRLTAPELLTALQQIEQEAGRIRQRRWGERTLDLDILLYGDHAIHSPDLTIPHVGILQRNFVVMPLLDLDAQLKIGTVSLKTSPVAQQAEGICQIADSSWPDC